MDNLEMEEVEVVTLEDGKDYVIVDEINSYVYLVNKEDSKSFYIRKVEKEMDDEFFVELSGENEFNKALLEFTKKHKDILKSN